MKKLTITLFSYRTYNSKTNVTSANHNILQASCRLEGGHRMDTSRVITISSDALSNLDEYVKKFIDYLKTRIYDNVEIGDVVVIDELQRDLPHISY